MIDTVTDILEALNQCAFNPDAHAGQGMTGIVGPNQTNAEFEKEFSTQLESHDRKYYADLVRSPQFTTSLKNTADSIVKITSALTSYKEQITAIQNATVSNTSSLPGGIQIERDLFIKKHFNTTDPAILSATDTAAAINAFTENIMKIKIETLQTRAARISTSVKTTYDGYLDRFKTTSALTNLSNIDLVAWTKYLSLLLQHKVIATHTNFVTTQEAHHARKQKSIQDRKEREAEKKKEISDATTETLALIIDDLQKKVKNLELAAAKNGLGRGKGPSRPTPVKGNSKGKEKTGAPKEKAAKTPNTKATPKTQNTKGKSKSKGRPRAASNTATNTPNKRPRKTD